MDVHISIAGEPNRAYANMITLLVYSLRVNGGSLSDAPVTVSTHESAMPPDRRRDLEQLGVTYRVMPRQYGGAGFVNKFNALYPPVDDYDILLFLDCDTVILGPLQDLVSGMDPSQAQFRARPIGKPGAQKAGDFGALIREHALAEERSLRDVADDRFPGGYPLFNAGVMAMTRPAVRRFRSDALRFACELYAQRARTTKASVWEMLKEAGRRTKKRLLPNASQSTYAFWITDQLGIALSLVKNSVDYEVLSPRFNWVYPEKPEDGALPSVFHYLSGRHPDVDREHLFEGAWTEKYLQGNSSPRHALARLAQEYASQHASVA